MPLSARLESSDNPVLQLNPVQLAARQRVLHRLDDLTYPTEDVPCFCGSWDGLVIAERDRYGLPVCTVLCTRCGLMRTTPRMTSEATSRFYQEDYRDLYSGHIGAQALYAEQLRRGPQYVKAVRPFLHVEAPIVFEVGCGAGGLLSAFQQTGAKVAGCDLGDDYLEVGRRHGLELVHGDIARLVDTVGCKADVIVLSHVVEHFLDLRSEMGQVIDALNPGGLLVVDVPGIASISQFYRGDILLYLQNAHNFHFTAATMGYVLMSLSLKIESITDQVLAIARRTPETADSSPQPLRNQSAEVLRQLAHVEKQLAASRVRPYRPRHGGTIEAGDSYGSSQ